MLRKILPLLIIAAAGYWYWTGPYKAGYQPSYEEKLQANAENMQKCTRGLAYKSGSTGQATGDPEEVCAQQYNLYQYEGQWYSYDDVRRED